MRGGERGEERDINNCMYIDVYSCMYTHVHTCVNIYIYMCIDMGGSIVFLSLEPHLHVPHIIYTCICIHMYILLAYKGVRFMGIHICKCIY